MVGQPPLPRIPALITVGILLLLAFPLAGQQSYVARFDVLPCVIEGAVDPFAALVLLAELQCDAFEFGSRRAIVDVPTFGELENSAGHASERVINAAFVSAVRYCRAHLRIQVA